MAEESTAASALRANIEEKGSNSYYYAHGSTPNGPAWDGREEPRLLEVATVTQSAPTLRSEILEYAWADSKKSIKVYVDFESADSIDDSLISLETTDNSLRFTVNHDNKLYIVYIDSLHDSITSATFKKKSSKFIISLEKDVEATWHQLKKTSS